MTLKRVRGNESQQGSGCAGTPGAIWGKTFDWNDLRYFLELMRTGRLGPTAKRLQVDHSTVGRRVTELEKALGAKLFDRTLTGFVPTESGRRVLAYAEEVERNALAIIESAVYPTQLAGTVRLATMEGLASFYLAPRLVEFYESQPGIVVELVTSAQLLNLTRREADVSLSFVRPTGPRLITQKVGQVDLKLYGAESYFRQHGEPKSIADLRHHFFVDYIEDQVQIGAVRWLLDAIKSPTVVFRSTSMISQRNAAAAGMGLVMLPSFLGVQDTRFRPLLVDQTAIKRDIWLATHEDLRSMARVKALTTFIKKRIAEDRDFLDGRTHDGLNDCRSCRVPPSIQPQPRQ
jgi:DNA-binding transcriptional LysR family regulator